MIINKEQMIIKEKLQPITLADKDLITKYFAKYEFLSCEQNFSNIFSWSQHYPVSWGKLQNSTDIALYSQDENIVLLPNNDITPQKLLELCSEVSDDLSTVVVGNVNSDYVKKYPEIADYFEIEQSDDFAEYIYSTESLINLTGKKLRKKKSHVKKFLNQYADQNIKVKSLIGNNFYDFAKIDFNSKNLEMIENFEKNMIISDVHLECQQFLQQYFSLDAEMPTDSEDFSAIERALKYYQELNLDGIVIYVANKIVAFALFSKQNSQTFTVHFEKINHSFSGASQFLNYCSAIYLSKTYGCKFINREQDLGIEGLRHAKKSYDPVFMFQLYNLKYKVKT